MPSLTNRLKHAWNAFTGRDPTIPYVDIGVGSGYRPDKSRFFFNGDKSIVTVISNRIAIDVASVTIEHAILDDNKTYKGRVNSGLSEALTLSANLDQTGRAFIQDAVMSMFDEGVVAIIPTDKDDDPELSSSYGIEKLRTGKIVEWYPRHVKVRVYNELSGRQEEIIVEKSYTAIIENPLYAVMNEPNSTLQRLIRTLRNLDVTDDQNCSGKLDLIIQLPYVIKSEARQKQAEMRRRAIEDQLKSSKYGIAYIDGTERVTQLNRAVENNLWTQAKDLTEMLFNQLGMTQGILDGTADEVAMLNYYNRTVEPITAAFADEMTRKFLTKNARTRGQAVIYFTDPFRLVPVSQMAEIADKFTRNEVLSPNEIRGIIGFKPSDDPKSNELRNRNLNESTEEVKQEEVVEKEEQN